MHFRLLLPILFLCAQSMAYAQSGLMADFDTWTPETLAARCRAEGGTNVRAELVPTRERAGKQNLRLVAQIERAKPVWSCVALRPEKPLPNGGQLTFWYRAEREGGLYLIVEDSKGRRVDLNFGRDLAPNTWHSITMSLKNAHVPNATPPNDRATLADVAVVRFHPYGKMYSADGEYAFQLDDLRVLPTGGDTPAEVLAPLANGGFEAIPADGTVPSHWNFSISSNARVTLAVDTQIRHEGARSLRFRNESELAPHVYGRLNQRVPVLPGTVYRLTAWVRAHQAGTNLHFTDWKSYNLAVPAGTYDWRQIAIEFETKPDQTALEVGLNLTNRANALWVDDIRLEAVASPLKSSRPDVSGAVFAPATVEGDNREMPVRVYLRAPAAFRGKAQVTVVAGGKERAGGSREFQGTGMVVLPTSSGEEGVDTLELRVALSDTDGKRIAETTRTVSKSSERVAAANLALARERLAALREQMAAARAAGIALDYPQVTATVAENFIPWTEEDLQKDEIGRAAMAARELRDSLGRALDEVARYRKQPSAVPQAVRYRTGKIEIRDGSFIGDRVDARGRTSRGPVFFTGYGHFGAVRRDVEKFPAYGINAIQIEFGPSSVLVSENEVSTTAVDEAVKVLDRAAEAGVTVNILLSPHYFPGWATAKWPELKGCAGGFLKFCVDAPESRQVIERYLRIVIPRLRNKPALHSLCLSNEPVWISNPECAHSKRDWAAYLAETHGSVAAMNARLGTSFADLAAVPIPTPADFDNPVFPDWCRFNQRRFAAWHTWMADIVHQMAPEIPVHSKLMSNFLNRNTIAYGTDPEQFAKFSQINGNDCAIEYPGGGEWAQNWQTQNIYYDIQRSMKWAPVFNSENHPITDRATRYYPPAHVRTALWQGAIHGQGATTMWVWERTYNRTADVYGNVMHRPGSAEAWGRTNLDLNRLADEVTALQKVPAPAAILYSVASIARDPDYLDTLRIVYGALNFTGVRVAFVSEEQIARGDLKRYRWLVVPQAGNVYSKTLEGIAAFTRGGGRLITAGDSPLARDEYGKAHPAGTLNTCLRGAVRLDMTKTQPELRDALLSTLGKDLPALRPVDAETGKVAWGVEWRVAQQGGRTLVNLVNLTKEPVRVRLQAGAAMVSGRNLITGERVAGEMRLEPLDPALVETAR